VLPLAGAGRWSSEARYRTRWAVRSNHSIWENPDTFTPCRRRRDGTWPRSGRRRTRGYCRRPRGPPLGSGLWPRGHLAGDPNSPLRDHVGGTEAVRARADLNVTAHPEETAFPTGERELRTAVHSRLLTLSSCHEVLLESRHRIIWSVRVRTCELVPIAGVATQRGMSHEQRDTPHDAGLGLRTASSDPPNRTSRGGLRRLTHDGRRQRHCQSTFPGDEHPPD
jgi:hypothetical protein